MSGVVFSNHIHIFASIPPSVREIDLVKAMKGRNSRVEKTVLGQTFLVSRLFLHVTSGNVIDEMIEEYINNYVDAHKRDFNVNISLE